MTTQIGNSHMSGFHLQAAPTYLMDPDHSLKTWIQEQYYAIGIDKNGQFVGKKLFAGRLVSFFGATEAAKALDKKSRRVYRNKIKQLVKDGFICASDPPTSTTETIAVPYPAPIHPPSTISALSAHANSSQSTVKPSAQPSLNAAASSSTARNRTAKEYARPKVKATVTPTTTVPAVNAGAIAIPYPAPIRSSAVSALTANANSSQSTVKPSAQPSLNAAASSSTARNQTAKESARPKVEATGTPKPVVPAVNPLHENVRKVEASSSKTSQGKEVVHPKVVQVPQNSRIQEIIDDIVYSTEKTSIRDNRTIIPMLDNQSRLLDLSIYSDSSEPAKLANDNVKNAVIFSTEVLRRYDSEISPQYALFGSMFPTMEFLAPTNTDPRLFLNVNVPFSAFICGLQGSGKSHTMSCILENSLIQAPILGELQRPLSALVFHFSQYTSRSSFRPCEASFLAYRHPNFREHTGVSSTHILVAPSNYHNLNASYSQIPGVKVRPFKLRVKDLTISSILNLMSVDQTDVMPLYVGQITKILRDITTRTGGEFNYHMFKEALKTCQLMPAQKLPLQQRLDLLESFLEMDDSAVDYSFEAGSVTVVDLSCPFVDANTACVLFNICIDVYLGSHPAVGKVIAIDEAHKYMTNTPASKALTESLLSVVRQQRHYGARVIISTQEPTISPRLMDLCSIIIIHRFSSPEWFNMVRKHVSISETDNAGLETLFARITNLRVGEALLFAPSAVITRPEETNDVVIQLNSNILKVKIRSRITWDGGKSVVCV